MATSLRQRRFGRPLFVIALLAATLSSGDHYLQDLHGVTKPLDFKYDYVSAYWIAEGHPAEALDRDTADALGTRLGTQAGPFWEGAPSQTHPPAAALLIRPLVPLGYKGATLAWFGFSLVLLLVLTRLLLAIWRGAERLPPLARSWMPAVALCLWPPVVFNLGYGQWSILLATLIAAGWWSYERRAPRWSAGWFAGAIAIKSTPALLLGFFALRARRLALGIVVALGAITAISWPFTGGLGAVRVFLASAGPAIRIFEIGTHNTASVRGIFARLFIASIYTTPIVDRPALAHALTAATTLLLLGVATALTLRRRAPDGPDAPCFAMWTCLIPLLNPLSWAHNVLVLLLPAALLARGPAPAGARASIAVTLVMLSVPRQILETLAGAGFPQHASRNWILGFHAVAGLLLFVTACRATLSAPGADRDRVGGAQA